MQPAFPKRKPNRLQGYSYSESGVYFITFCTEKKAKILSTVLPPADALAPPCIVLKPYGVLTQAAIRAIPMHYAAATVEHYVIMPNHVHLLLRIDNSGGRQIAAPTVVGNLKRAVSMEIGRSIWQKGFYDHIVRDESDYRSRWEYIDANPARWLAEKDEYF